MARHLWPAIYSGYNYYCQIHHTLYNFKAKYNSHREHSIFE